LKGAFDKILEYEQAIEKRRYALPEILRAIFERSPNIVPLDKGYFAPFEQSTRLVQLPLPFGSYTKSHESLVMDWYGHGGRVASDSKLVVAAFRNKTSLLISNWQTDNNVQDYFRAQWGRKSGIAIPIYSFGCPRGVLIVGFDANPKLEHIKYLNLAAERILRKYIEVEDRNILLNTIHPNRFHLSYFEFLLDNALQASDHYEKGTSFEKLVQYLLSTMEGVHIIATRQLSSIGEVDILLLNNSYHEFWINKSKEVIIECKNLKERVSAEVVRDVYAKARLANSNTIIIFSREDLTSKGKGSGLEIVFNLLKLGVKILVVSLRHIRRISYNLSPAEMLQEVEAELACKLRQYS
jgi:Holliday junction resolvase-like predicted endonuclease